MKKTRYIIIGVIFIVIIIGIILIGLFFMVQREGQFGIYIANLDGNNVINTNLLISDNSRQLNHAHVSPDKEWIVFTRFNKKNKEGLALEVDGYEQTDILLMKLDGSGLRTLVSAKKNVVNALGTWTSNGKVIYLSTETGIPQAFIIDINTKEKIRVPTPEGLSLVDPYSKNDKIVFSTDVNGKKRIHIMDLDGSNFKQISFNIDSKQENDAKISPNGKKVAFFRNLGLNKPGDTIEVWHMIIIDLNTLQEKDISVGRVVDGVPEWNKDSNKLIFFSFNIDNPIPIQMMYTINIDGSQRTKLNSPSGFNYVLPVYFPEDDSKIIFSARKLL